MRLRAGTPARWHAGALTRGQAVAPLGYSVLCPHAIDRAAPAQLAFLRFCACIWQSTTHDLSVAVRYSQSTSSVLLRLETKSFRERGADLTFLSAFPAERECLFPPLTHMRPVGEPQDVNVGALTYTVLDVKPSFG